jgi:hypothetical protein
MLVNQKKKKKKKERKKKKENQASNFTLTRGKGRQPFKYKAYIFKIIYTIV